jgi:hypothetical protein
MADDQNQNDDGNQDQDQDSSDDSQDTGQDQGTLDGDSADQKDDSDKGQKFNSEQLQQLGSMFGTIIQKHVNDAVENQVKPILRGSPAPTGTGTGGFGNDGEIQNNPAYSQLNEKLLERFMGGDVLGTYLEMDKLRKAAQKNLTEGQKKSLSQELTRYAEKPNYKDIFPNMEQMASMLVEKEGYPPEAAARLSFEACRANYLEGKSRGGDGSLDLGSSGKRTTPTSTGKLPPQFEDAYQRDKAEGLYKNRKEYIEGLDPRVRVQHNL